MFNFRIIESIERFAALVPLNNQTNNDSVADQIMFTRGNFAVFVSVQDPSTFQGQLIQAVLSLESDINDVNLNGTRFIANSNTIDTDFLASVNLTQELFTIFQNNTPPNELPRLAFVIYDINSLLFQDRITERNSTEGGVILSVQQSIRDLELQNPAPPTNLEELVKFQFRTNQVNRPNAFMAHTICYQQA